MKLPRAHRTQKRKTSGVWYVRWAAWRGGPAIGNYHGATLRDADAAAEADAEGLAERYAAARKAEPDPGQGTLAGVLAKYRASAAFETGLSDYTRAQWGRAIDAISADAIGKLKTVALASERAPGVIEDWRDRIARERGRRTADYWLQVLRRALNWAKRRGDVRANPALGLETVWSSDRSELIWEAAHLEAYFAYTARRRRELMRAKASANRARALHALELAEDVLIGAIWSGMRRDDLSAAASSWIQGQALVYVALKGQRRARTAGKTPKTTVVPIGAELAAVIDRRLGDRRGWIFTSFKGARYTREALGRLVNETAKAAGVDRHLHDAKGTFVTLMKIRGESDEAIAGMVDWSIDDVRQIARRYVAQSQVVAAAIARFNRRA